MNTTCILDVFLLIVTSFLSVQGSPEYLQSILELDDPFREQWVNVHNHYRRKVMDPEAANMRLMTWDDGLEDFAKNVVATCTFEHTHPDKLKTDVFPKVGENLYSGNLYRATEMAEENSLTKAWYEEINFYNYSTTTCVSKEQCGHFTQVVWAETYKVGCAIAQCEKVTNGYPSFFVSCNYGPAGNLVYEGGRAVAPYVSGEPCSQCGEGDLCIDQLCNNTERDIPFTTTTTIATTVESSTTEVTSTEVDMTTSSATTEVTSIEIVMATTPCSENTTCGGNRTTTASGAQVRVSVSDMFIQMLLMLAFSKLF